MATHAEVHSTQGPQGPAGPAPTDSGNKVLATPADGSSSVMAPRVLVGADLPTPTTSVFGGVKDLAAVAAKYITSIVNGQPIAAIVPTVTTSNPGLAPTLPNVATSYLDGTGAYSVPTGGAHIAAGANVYPTYPCTTTGGSGWSNFTLMYKLPGRLLLNMPASWKFSMVLATHSIALDKIKILVCALDSTTVSSRTVVTIGSSTTPTVVTGTTFCDSISLQLDSSHDYYIAWHVLNGADATAVFNKAAVSAWASNAYVNNCGYISGDHVDDSTLPTLTTGNFFVDQVLST